MTLIWRPIHGSFECFARKLAAGGRSVATAKRLAERRKERNDRSQPPNGSVAQLRGPQAETNARGAKWSKGHQGAITVRSACWFRRILVAAIRAKRLFYDRAVDDLNAIIKFPPMRSIQIRLETQDNSPSKSGSLSRSPTTFSCIPSPPSDSACSPQMLRRLP